MLTALLAAIAASLPFATLALTLGPAQFSPTELLLLVALVVAAPGLIRRIWSWPRTAFDAPLSLFLGASLLSFLVTEYPRLSLRELRTVIVEPVAYFVLVCGLLTTPGSARWVVSGLLGSTALVALVALGQFASGHGVVDTEGVRRAVGTYPSPNHLALMLGRTLPFFLALGWTGPDPRWPYRIGGLLAAGALLASFSIGGWLGTAAALIVVMGLIAGRRAALLAVGLAALFAVTVLPLVQVERVLSHLDPARGTSFLRLQLWSASIQMVRDHPLLGIGLDNFLYLYQQEYLPPAAAQEPNLSHPHNWVLHFWLSLGLPGLVSLLWLLQRFARAIRPLLASPSSLTRALAIGAVGSMVDFLVHGSLDNSYFLVDMAFTFWLTLGVVVVLSKGERH